MSFLDKMKRMNTIENTKGSEYYASTYSDNLDVFTMLTRYNPSDEIITMFNNALVEDEKLALANLLYILDVRNGKGERLLFQTIFKDLCLERRNLALKILPFIKELGRFDYILIGINTPIEKEVIELIKKQLECDMNSDTPSLLAKWLPTHRTHGENNELAKIIMKRLGMKEKEYRKMLATLRSKINIIEKNLTNRTYDNVDFSKVPTKAMLKYTVAYERNMLDKYTEYKEQVKNGEAKINTKGLLAYEIVKKILFAQSGDYELYDLMWKNQKDIFEGVDTNVLVVADTSGSMMEYGSLPYATSIGLALYTAERNRGIFKNHFITFSKNPILQEIKGNNIYEKVKNVKSIVENTDIDKVFELILNTALKNRIEQTEMPSHILIISDMEFDVGVYTKKGTNFDGWKKAFARKGYKLPKIVFWNVAAFAQGVPVTKFDADVAMISGFSTNVLERVLSLEDYSLEKVMLEKLAVYLEMLVEK